MTSYTVSFFVDQVKDFVDYQNNLKVFIEKLVKDFVVYSSSPRTLVIYGNGQQQKKKAALS